LAAEEMERTLVELETLIFNISTISSIELCVILSMDAPYPNLKPVLDLLRKHTKYVRYVIIERERSPGRVYQQLQSFKGYTEADLDAAQAQHVIRIPFQANPAEFLTVSTQEPLLDSVDPYEVLLALERATDGLLTAKEGYVPIGLGFIVAPLLKLTQTGAYSLNANPFCAFGTVLITLEGKTHAVSDLFDLRKLIQQGLPLLAELEKNKKGKTPSLLQLNKARNLIKSCLTAEAKQKHDLSVTKLLSVFFSSANNATTTTTTTTTTSEATSTTAQDDGSLNEVKANTLWEATQVILVHNRMDFASMDMQRRCRCAVVSVSSVAKHGYAASCSGCL
jgi:hypothetical protein